MSPQEVADVRDWQRTDRTYELVQLLLRGAGALHNASAGEVERAIRVAEALDRASTLGATPERLRQFRGIRNLVTAFGTDDLQKLMTLRSIDLRAMTATSIHRDLAIDQFTRPSGALLEIDVPEGVPAVWVAAIGDPSLRYQGELLFVPPLEIRFVAHGREDGMLVLSLEVIS